MISRIIPLKNTKVDFTILNYVELEISRHLWNINYPDLTHSSEFIYFKMNSRNLNNCFCNKWLADLGRSLVQIQSRHLCLVAQLVAHPTANGNQSFIAIIILFKLRFRKVHIFFGAPTQGTCFRDVLVFLTPR